MNKIIVYSLAICFTFLTCFYANTSLDGQTIKNFELSIQKTDSSTQDEATALETVLIKGLKTHEGQPFSQLLFDKDLKSLADKFDRVDPFISSEPDGLVIKVKLWPKPFIKAIDWDGNSYFSTNKLQKELDIRRGTFFDRNEFHIALNKVKDLYLKKGFFESDITYDLNKKGEYAYITIHIHEGKAGHVSKIQFTGLTKEEESEVISLLYTKTYNFLISWLTGHGFFRTEALEQDQMIILNYLQNKGYADAKLDAKILDGKSKDRIIIDINVHRGPLYRFGEITFDGNQIISNEEIKKHLLIHQNDVYSPEKLRESVQELKDLYGQKGYIDTNIYYDTVLSEIEPVYNVLIHINEGEKYIIGLIKIYGNTQTKSNVILRESLLVPGEVFDSRRLKATQTRLENMSYFKNVNVYAVKSSEESTLGKNYRDVYIEVEETMTGSINLSAGMSTLNDVYGGLELTERNFNYKGLFTLFSEGFAGLRGGGEYFHAKANWGAKQQNYLISWMNPYFRDTLWRLGLEGSITTSRLISDDYKTKTMGISIFTSYPITNYWTFGIKYRIRDSHTDVKENAGEKARKEAESNGIISAFSSSISFDSTDNAYKAHRGLRSGIEGEVVGIWGDFTFFKMAFVNTLYHPVLWKNGTMKYRADINFIEPFGNTTKDGIPLSERYFLGGEGTVRGYKPFILGPRFSKLNDPRGGISSALLSAEYNHELHRLIDVFAFFDAGSVSDEHFKIRKLNTSVGLGLRLQLTSRIPMMVGWAYPINPDHRRDEQRVFFSMIGQF